MMMKRFVFLKTTATQSYGQMKNQLPTFTLNIMTCKALLSLIVPPPCNILILFNQPRHRYSPLSSSLSHFSLPHVPYSLSSQAASPPCFCSELALWSPNWSPLSQCFFALVTASHITDRVHYNKSHLPIIRITRGKQKQHPRPSVWFTKLPRQF